MPTIGIVVPVYRNAETLPALAARVRHAMVPHRLDYRLVFVVDGSPDTSREVVQRIAMEDGAVTGLYLSDNVGQHAAIVEGLDAIDAELIAVMDADLQDPPELLPAMVNLARESGSTVFAQRRGRYQSRARMLTSRAFKTLLAWFTGVPADVGTFLVMDRQVGRAVRECGVRPPQVVVLAHHFSTTTAFVTFDRPTRANGRSAYSAAARVRAAVRSLRCALECRRLPRRPSRIPRPASRHEHYGSGAGL